MKVGVTGVFATNIANHFKTADMLKIGGKSFQL